MDTNILVRGVVYDDPEQMRLADDLLRRASLIAISLPCICELVWVLRSVYGLPRFDVARAIRALIDAANVEMDRDAVEAGLALLENGGDFADGVIAYEGAWLGGETFVSFDKRAVDLLRARHIDARLLT